MDPDLDPPSTTDGGDETKVPDGDSTIGTVGRVASLTAALERHVSESSAQLATLTEISTQNTRQLEALSTLVAGSSTKQNWFQRHIPLSLVVSIVAFTFGVFTWMVAERAREGSELREARAELTSTLDELATIQSEFEMESARALEADLRFPHTPAQTVAFNRVVTHLRWSVALGFTGACDGAAESFDAALSELEQRNENEWRLYRSEVMGQAGWYATYCSPVDDTFVQRLAAMGYV